MEIGVEGQIGDTKAALASDTPRAVLGSRPVAAYLSRKHWLT